MLFVEGIGYVDDTTYINKTDKSTNSVSDNFAGILSVETDKLNKSNSRELDDIFREASEKYNVSCELLKAIAYNESRYNPNATSSAGAMGIMQLMPATAKSMGVTNAYDPYENIMGGAKLLSRLSELYNGNQTLMIAAYNAGSGNVEKYGGVPPFEETRNYVQNVLNTLNQGTQSTQTTVISGITNNYSELYGKTDTDNSFGYDEYELMMQYLNTMLEIISGIGDTDDDSKENSSDNSLLDLYMLSYKQNNLKL